MNFEFSDEQQQLHDTVDRYLTDQYTFEKFRAINASAAGWDKAAWAGLGELGVLALNVPAEQGGLGFGPLETLSVMGACGKSLLLEPFLSSAVIATAVLRACADDPAAADLIDSHGERRCDRGARPLRARLALRVSVGHHARPQVRR